MKKAFKSFFVSALLVLICFTLVSCGPKIDEMDASVNNAPFGAKYPEKINAAHKINSTMDALQMYEAGVKNFYEASFTAARQLGNITTNAPVVGEMSQKLDCFRIKQDDIYYLDSRSYTISGSPNIKMCDQSIYQDGKYRVRSADKKNITVDKEANLSVSKWPEIEEFTSLKSGLKKYPDDLTKINMFTVNENTVKSSTKPIYDAKNKTYKFTLTMDYEAATKKYIPVMEYKTKKGGVTADGIKFKKLKFTVLMWDNGLIKSIDIEEGYIVTAKIMGIKTDSTTNLFSTTYFTYDKAEVNINNYLVF